MSEIVPAAGSTESASSTSSSASTPTSTADIAASVISDLDSGGDVSSQSSSADTSKKPVDTGDTTQKTDVDPDDFDTVPAEATDSLGRKRVNSIPHPRVKTMIEKREKKLIATVAKELGITKAEAELQLDDVLSGVKERGSKLTEFEQRVKQIEAVEQIMLSEPERFFDMLVKFHPQYAEWKRSGQAAVASAQAPNAENDPEPEPDYDLGNGQKTYSLDGLRKLRAWERRQAVAEIEGKLGERLKPFEEKQRQEQEAARIEEQRQGHRAQIAKRLERARKWPQFKEHEPDIQKFVDAEHGKGNFITFEDAYMQIVIPKLAGDRTSIRKEVLDEINKQPYATSVTQTSTPKQADKPKSTADIAREIMAQMGG